jgi:alpha-ribazole phosphatase
MKSYYIHFIRHGLTDAALEGRYIGHTDVSLCEEGRAQLLELKDDCKYPQVQAVFSSPLKRCTQTAQILYPACNAIIIQDLIEYNFGEFENLTAEELKDHPVFSSWLAGEKDAPFGETNEDFSNRICNAMSKIIDGMMKASVTSAAVITHGGIIMALLSAFGLPEASMHEWMTPSGCGYTVRITPSLWMRNRKFEVISETPKNPDELYSDDENDKIYWEDV